MTESPLRAATTSAHLASLTGTWRRDCRGISWTPASCGSGVQRNPRCVPWLLEWRTGVHTAQTEKEPAPWPPRPACPLMSTGFQDGAWEPQFMQPLGSFCRRKGGCPSSVSERPHAWLTWLSTLARSLLRTSDILPGDTSEVADACKCSLCGSGGEAGLSPSAPAPVTPFCSPGFHSLGQTGSSQNQCQTLWSRGWCGRPGRTKRRHRLFWAPNAPHNDSGTFFSFCQVQSGCN